MNERKRLIELISEAEDKYPTIPLVNGCKPEFKYFLASYLLANGVIVPPVKVGDTVWIIDDYDCDPYPLAVKVDGFKRDKISDWIILRYPLGIKYQPQTLVDGIGKTVFLSREQAEKVLAERSRE